MTPPPLPVEVRGRFHRSVQLSADYAKAEAGYVLTPTAKNLSERMVSELERPNGVRTWSVTGPYGTGKSAFALYLTRLLSGQIKAALKPLPKLRPTLITGHRVSLRQALITGLSELLQTVINALQISCENLIQRT